MSGYVIRALTLHLGTADISDPQALANDLQSAASALLEAIDRASSRLSVKPTYVRISLPGIAPNMADALVKATEPVSKEVLVSSGGLELTQEGVDAAVRLAEASVYAPLLLREPSWEAARLAARAMIRASSSDPANATRIAVNVLGIGHFITPYYPLASATPGKELITAALTYPNYLADAYRSGGLKALEVAALEAGRAALAFASTVAEEGSYEVGGVDLSVSPWMEDSSLGLTEMVAGVRMPRPGFTLGVRAVNEAIRSAASKLQSVGFNEVMLPVGEDSRLKARASEGDVTARYLAMLSGVCVAGLDMVAVPADEAGIAGLILDVASYSRAKGSPLGVRIIPVEGAEPGDKVDLRRFGESPIIAI